MRGSLLAALLLCASLAPVATAEDPCANERTALEPVEGAPASLTIEERECATGERSIDIALLDPDGRTNVQWYDDERGSGIAVFRPPRFFLWHEDERGCFFLVFVIGEVRDPGCVLGPPPDRPHVPR